MSRADWRLAKRLALSHFRGTPHRLVVLACVIDWRRLLTVQGLQVDPKVLEALSEVERRQVLEELQVLEQAYKQNPLLGYQPHHKQQEFHRPDLAASVSGAIRVAEWPPLRCFFGGNRSGKTTATMVDTIIQCVDRELVPEHLAAFKRWDPPFYGRVVTPDLTNTLEGVVLQKFREWCPRGALKGGSFERAYDKVLRMLWFKNGSWVQFFSNDQDVDKFGGAALHRVVYDEEPRQDVRSESLTRLIDYDGEELFGMTPLNGMSWAYDEIYEPWERGELQDGRVVVVDMDDNPHLSPAGKKRALAAYSGEEREARKSGRFVSFAGLIYPMFSTSRHVIPDEDQVPEGVECFEGLDPGMRHMAAVVFCYLTPDDRLVVYDELALQGKTVEQVAKQIRLKRAQWKVRPRFTVIDPAARNKSPQTGRSDQQEYLDHGILTIPGQNDVRPGINRVRERLEADGRLMVAARCTEMRREFKRYRWAKDSKRSESAPPDRPVKKDDHLLDALRYVLMLRPLVPDVDVPREGDTVKHRMLRQHLKRLRGLSKAADPGSGYGPGQFV